MVGSYIFIHVPDSWVSLIKRCTQRPTVPHTEHAFEEEKWRIGLKTGHLEINGEEHEMKLHSNPS